MTEQAVVEYVANCAWQVPLLAAGAWALVKLARPALRTEYWLWVSVLTMAVVLPLRGVEDHHGTEGRRFVAAQPGNASAPTVKNANTSFQRGEENAATVRQRIAAIRSGLRGFRLEMNTRETHWFVGLYMVALLFAGVRLFAAWRNARRLVRKARETVLSAEAMRSLREAGVRIGVRVPEVRESTEIAGPIIVGAFRPVLLLPESAREYAEEEMRAAVCHELAHVKRHDYLANLLCEALMLPVSWHPAANAVERRIQQTREMVCDQMAAEAMESGEEYARCLVSVTRRIMERSVVYQRTQAVGFFDRNILEERVMRLTGEGETMTTQSSAMRAVCGAAALAVVVGVASTCHVKPTFAAEMSKQEPAGVAPAGSSQATASELKPPAAVATTPATVEHPAKPLAIARGAHARVMAEPGEFVHRWTSRDGEAFAMVNHEAVEPDERQRQAVERKLDDVHTGSPDALLLDLPEIRLDMKELDLSKVQMEEANQLMNSPEMKRQMEEIKRLGKLNAEKQIADLKLDLLHLDPQINLKLQLQSAQDAMNDAQVKALLDSKTKLMSEAQVNTEIAKAMQEQRAGMVKLQRDMESGELKAKLEAAQKLLDEVKRQMDTMQKEKN